MLLPSGLSYHLLCTGLHIQMTLLAEVIEFAFISQKQLRDKKKSWLSTGVMIFSERSSINLNLLLLTELLSASLTIYICEGLLKNSFMTAFMLMSCI